MSSGGERRLPRVLTRLAQPLTMSQAALVKLQAPKPKVQGPSTNRMFSESNMQAPSPSLIRVKSRVQVPSPIPATPKLQAPSPSPKSKLQAPRSNLTSSNLKLQTPSPSLIPAKLRSVMSGSGESVIVLKALTPGPVSSTATPSSGGGKQSPQVLRIAARSSADAPGVALFSAGAALEQNETEELGPAAKASAGTRPATQAASDSTPVRVLCYSLDGRAVPSGEKKTIVLSGPPPLVMMSSTSRPPAHGEMPQADTSEIRDQAPKGPSATSPPPLVPIQRKGTAPIGLQAGSEAAQGSEKSGRHQCPACSAIYLTRGHLKKHVRLHLAEKRKDQRNISALMRCLSYKRSDSRCRTCDTYFPSRAEYIEHRQQAHSVQKPYACPFCNVRFTTIACRDKHQRAHGREKLAFPCPKCDASFVSKGSLSQHLSIHGLIASDKKCSQCDAIFPSEHDLKTHLRTHKGENREASVCAICGARFRLPRYLRAHVLAHARNPLGRTHQCSHCDANFKRQSALKLHEKVHTTSIATHSCPHCPATFYRIRQLNFHMRVHPNKVSPPRSKNSREGERLTSPTMQPDTPNQRSSYQSASRVGADSSSSLVLDPHDNSESDDCLLLDEITVEPADIVTDTEEMSAFLEMDSAISVPSDCGEASNDLERHERTRPSGKTYEECMVCNEIVDDLKNHVLIHFEETTIPSPRSDSSLSMSSKASTLATTMSPEVKQHSDALTGDLPFLCTECGASFCSKKDMLSHLHAHLSED